MTSVGLEDAETQSELQGVKKKREAEKACKKIARDGSRDKVYCK